MVWQANRTLLNTQLRSIPMETTLIPAIGAGSKGIDGISSVLDRTIL
jgi:hypothetical protein